MIYEGFDEMMSEYSEVVEELKRPFSAWMMRISIHFQIKKMNLMIWKCWNFAGTRGVENEEFQS